MKRTILSAALLLSLPLAARAADEAKPEGWTGSGELGLAFARGNARSETVNGKRTLGKEDETWKHDFGLQILRVKGEVDDEFELTANRYELSASSAYKFDEKQSVIGALRYENDDFAPFEYQAVASISYGYNAIDNERTHLGFEVGPGYRRAKNRSTGEVEGDAVLRGRADYRHQLTETTQLTNVFLVEGGEDNTFAQNDLAVSVKINSKLALKSGLQVRHNTDNAPGTTSTDKLLTTNLVFSF